MSKVVNEIRKEYPELWREVRIIAFERGVKIKEVLVEALREYVERKKGKGLNSSSISSSTIK